eukprot:6184639-Pleurochrysis_carterae.AAC.2
MMRSTSQNCNTVQVRKALVCGRMWLCGAISTSLSKQISASKYCVGRRVSHLIEMSDALHHTMSNNYPLPKPRSQ